MDMLSSVWDAVDCGVLRGSCALQTLIVYTTMSCVCFQKYPKVSMARDHGDNTPSFPGLSASNHYYFFNLIVIEIMLKQG